MLFRSPEILDCDQFVNADEIAKGLSPFNSASTNIQSGRLMLKRIRTLLNQGENFAIETTLSTRSYVKFVEEAQQKGYRVTLLFFWLNSEDLAVKRVQGRVKEGGHDIPEKVIRRRYETGLFNFFKLYITQVHNWLFINNSGEFYEVVAQGDQQREEVLNKEIWMKLRARYYG